jgi:putative Holliday junction resolvase
VTSPSRPGSILGVDYGERRIGVAVAGVDGFAARPLTTIAVGRGDAEKAREQAMDSLAALAREQGARELVVGLPLEASGIEGAMAALVRAFAREVEARLGLPVTLRDERLSSEVATGRVGRPPRGRSGGAPTRAQRERYRARVDREAAAVILQDELDARRARGEATDR